MYLSILSAPADFNLLVVFSKTITNDEICVLCCLNNELFVLIYFHFGG